MLVSIPFRFVVCFVVVLSLAGLPNQAQASKECANMTKQICQSLGDAAYICGVYTLATKHPKVNHNRCKALLSQQWQKRLQNLKRIEATFKRMDAMAARATPQQKTQINRYKTLWSQCTVARLLTTAPADPPSCQQLNQMMKTTRKKVQNNPQGCKLLQVTLCNDVGVQSFYCMLFSKLLKRRPTPLSRCNGMLRQWPTRFKKEYRKRERAIRFLTRLAQREHKYKARLTMFKKREILRVYKMLFE